MSGQAPDLRRSAQIVRRHRVLGRIVAALGLVAGAGLPYSTRRCSRAIRSLFCSALICTGVGELPRWRTK
jgi:hypothetical protein